MSVTSLVLGSAIAAIANHGAAQTHAADLATSATLSLAYAPVEAGASTRLPWQDEASGEAASADAGVEGEARTASRSFGSAGTTRWYLQFGGASDFASDDGNFGLAGVGLSNFIADDLALNFELNVMLFDQPGDEAAGLNLGMLLQWHFSKERDSSWFVEAGIGLLGTNDDVPELGSSFNFTPQAGVGYTVEHRADTRFMIGVRWYHISNAQLFEENPGRDSVLLYAGFSFAY